MRHANLQFSCQECKDLASEFQSIVTVNLEGAAKDSQVLLHEGVRHSVGSLVRDGVEADESAEPILAGQDIPITGRCQRQGAYQVNIEHLLGIALTGGHMDAILDPLSGDLLDAFWAGLNHQPDISLHAWPPEMTSNPGHRSFHTHVTGQGGAVGQVKCFSVESIR